MTPPRRAAASAATGAAGPVETELKFALACAAPAELAASLAAADRLAAAPFAREWLDSTYFDTPGQTLRKARMALRVRRVSLPGRSHWVQTLKTAPLVQEAVARRGEWEADIPDARPDQAALEATPWLRFDPLGVIFAQLEAVFQTRFERCTWQVHGPQGSHIEVALDIGSIEAGAATQALCELELELRRGPVSALFDLALDLAATVPMLPLSTSKAERGWLLAGGEANAPLRACPPPLDADLSLQQVAQRVLVEMFAHFTDNLARVQGSADPELLHQTRVGWRRLLSALRLLWPALPEPPSWAPLRPLLNALGQSRDLDVVRDEVLSPLGVAWSAGDAGRQRSWEALSLRLREMARERRAEVLHELRRAEVSRFLVSLQAWLAGLSVPAHTASGHGAPASSEATTVWARRRVSRLAHRLETAASQPGDTASAHRVRILAKRLRYGAEALRPLLPPRRAQRWLQQALGLQSALGASRDLTRAIELAQDLGADAGLVGYLRGVAAARARPG